MVYKATETSLSLHHAHSKKPSLTTKHLQAEYSAASDKNATTLASASRNHYHHIKSLDCLLLHNTPQAKYHKASNREHTSTNDSTQPTMLTQLDPVNIFNGNIPTTGTLSHLRPGTQSSIAP
jgi:hypothetical protein